MVQLRSFEIQRKCRIDFWLQKHFKLDSFFLSCGLHRPKNVTKAVQCFLVGKAVRFVPQQEVRTLLSNTIGDEIQHHTLQKVLRIMINGKVYYSEEYKRMRKKVCYAVMFQSDAETEFGFIKYFVHSKDTDETYAIMHIPEVSNSPLELRRFSLHHIWLSGERYGALL